MYLKVTEIVQYWERANPGDGSVAKECGHLEEAQKKQKRSREELVSNTSRHKVQCVGTSFLLSLIVSVLI